MSQNNKIVDEGNVYFTNMERGLMKVTETYNDVVFDNWEFEGKEKVVEIMDMGSE